MSRDRRLEQMSGIEPRDERFGEVRLLGVLRENGGAIAWANVGRLAVHLGRVVRHGEVNLQKLGVADPRRVVGDLHRFGVAGAFGADRVVVGIAAAAAGIAGDDVGHALYMLEHAFHAPEAASREYRSLLSRSSNAAGSGGKRQNS